MHFDYKVMYFDHDVNHRLQQYKEEVRKVENKDDIKK